MATTNGTGMVGVTRMWRAALRPRLVVGALAALAITALPVPSSAATVTTYTVSATRGSSFVDVTFTRPFTLDMGKTRVTGSGWYTGYYFQPLAAAPDSGHGEIWITEFNYPTYKRSAMPLGNQDAILSYQSTFHNPKGTNRRLPAGRYRLHILADRSAQVRFALGGAGSSRSLTATRPSPFAAVWKDITPNVVGQKVPGAATADVPITVRSSDSLTFLAFYIVRHATAHTLAASANLCLGSTEHPILCTQDQAPGLVDPDDYGYGYGYEEVRAQHPTTLADAAYGFASYYKRNVAPTGSLAAHFDIVTPAVMDRVVVAAFSLAY